jgi:tetratricopeptide (TPR) repeat protein
MMQSPMWRAKADSIAGSLVKNNTSHAHHTLVKSAIATVKEVLEKAEQTDDELTHQTFSEAVKTAEERLREGLQRFPNEPYLLTEEASLSAILRNADRALKALQKAFEKNPKSEFVARRYACNLRAQGAYGEAVEGLRRGLEYSPGSYPLNYDIAQAIRASEADADTTKIDQLLYHFQRSYSKGDKNYEAQFWYARQLCIAGRQSEAKPIFEILKKVPVAFDQKRNVKGVLENTDGSPRAIYGVVYRLSRTPSSNLQPMPDKVHTDFYACPGCEAVARSPASCASGPSLAITAAAGVW